jgi:signal transduction histidine kinase
MQADIPDNSKVMRTAAWIWIVYLACILGVDLVIYANRPWGAVLWYYLVNFLPALVFLGLAYSSWLKKFSGLITALMILLISIAPILLLHLLDLKLPQAPLSNLEGMVLRQLPVLMIGLVLVAWHYRLVIMVLYSVAINIFEFSTVLMLERLTGERLSAFYFIVIVRMVCFIVVGIFVNQLITYLRSQQHSLKIANQQLSHYASTLESLTVSRERNRMSRELHDTVVHTLSGLAVQLETSKAYLDADPETARKLLDQSLDATRSGLQETRRALKALRASPLEDLGFTLALQEMLDAAAERGILVLDLSLPNPPPVFSPDIEQCLYRITQEAVENVVQHANAQHLGVRLTTGDGDVELIVRDDGIGFTRDQAHRPCHFGIAGMEERALLAGGVLTITGMPGAGTTVCLVIKGYKQ